jgi:hypothetical protein
VPFLYAKKIKWGHGVEMSKIFKQRNWLYVEEAVEYLSKRFNERITVKDIYALSADEKLPLSVYINTEYIGARRCILNQEKSKLEIDSHSYEPSLGICNYLGVHQYIEDQIFELPNFGCGKGLINSLVTNQGACNIQEILDSVVPFDYWILKRSNGEHIALIDKLYENHTKKDGTFVEKLLSANLPKGTALIVQKKHLLALVHSIETDEKVTQADAPLVTRERNTLLTIIAALCKEAKIDYSTASKAAYLIQGAAASLGVNIGETTIEGHLKKSPMRWKAA